MDHRLFSRSEVLGMTVLAGIAVQELGVIPTIAGMSVTYVAVTVSMLARPVIR
jgi:hypothetical protein